MEEATEKTTSAKKHSSRAIPNVQLKEERLLRGWSQQYVAEQLGADYYYISRWERGIASPSPYYRQKLCDLFGKNAYELGFLQDKPSQEPEASAEPSSLSRSEDMMYTLMLSATTNLVGREEPLSSLNTLLCAEPYSGPVALYGLPGVGKTTLAATLLTHEHVLKHFRDGFLWASLGPQPNPFTIFSRWGRLLGISDAETSRFTSIKMWTQALHLAIGKRKMLIVIDDVWQAEDALTFKVSGSPCMYLFTTRFATMARQLAGTRAMPVQELPEKESLALLDQLAPGLITQEPQAAQNLIRAVGGLPLALTLAGKYLQVEMHSGQPRRLFSALARLHAAEERLRLSTPQALFERSPSLQQDKPVSLQSIIEVSDQFLPPVAQQALRDLAVFPAKPNTFSEDAALAVINAPLEILDILLDMGLIESAGIGRYMLHQVIADYARIHQQSQAPYHRFIDYFTRHAATHEQEYEELERESNNILAALENAYSRGEHTSFIRLAHTNVRFWLARGSYARAIHYLEKARESAQCKDMQREVINSLLMLGNIALRQGHYDQASHYLHEGLSLIQGDNNWQLHCDFLTLLGRVALYQCNYQVAENYFQQALPLARQHTDLHRLCTLLKAIGAGGNDQGHYAFASQYLQEGLGLARQIQDPELLIEVLIDLGQNEAYQGHPLQAEAYWKEALPLAHTIRYRPAITMLLGNLGAIAIEQEEYEKGRTFLLESLHLSQQLENHETACINLANLGDLCLKQRDYEQARHYLQDALALVRSMGNLWLLCGVLLYWGELHLQGPWQDLTVARAAFREVQEQAATGLQDNLAEALFGLGRVALLEGAAGEARRLGQESLTILENIGNRVSTKVAHWLATLPE